MGSSGSICEIEGNPTRGLVGVKRGLSPLEKSYPCDCVFLSL